LAIVSNLPSLLTQTCSSMVVQSQPQPLNTSYAGDNVVKKLSCMPFQNNGLFPLDCLLQL
jgi:hypothetical protein